MTTEFRSAFAEAVKKNEQGKPILLVMAGIPASGKSSVLAQNRELLDSAGFAILEAKTFQKELWKQDQGERRLLFCDPLYREYYERAEKEAEAAALWLLGKGENVVLDSTYNRKTRRREAENLCVGRKGGGLRGGVLLQGILRYGDGEKRDAGKRRRSSGASLFDESFRPVSRRIKRRGMGCGDRYMSLTPSRSIKQEKLDKHRCRRWLFCQISIF